MCLGVSKGYFTIIFKKSWNCTKKRKRCYFPAKMVSSDLPETCLGFVLNFSFVSIVCSLIYVGNNRYCKTQSIINSIFFKT